MELYLRDLILQQPRRLKHQRRNLGKRLRRVTQMKQLLNDGIIVLDILYKYFEKMGSKMIEDLVIGVAKELLGSAKVAMPSSV